MRWEKWYRRRIIGGGQYSRNCVSESCTTLSQGAVAMEQCLFIWKHHQELINPGEGSMADPLYSPEIIYVSCTVRRSYEQKNPLHSNEESSSFSSLALRIFCMLVSLYF